MVDLLRETSLLRVEQAGPLVTDWPNAWSLPEVQIFAWRYAKLPGKVARSRTNAWVRMVIPLEISPSAKVLLATSMAGSQMDQGHPPTGEATPGSW